MSKITGKVLLVDDDEFFLAMMEEALIAHGHSVTAVPDGVMAITAAESDPPDLILLDIIMPRMDGLEVLQILKQSPVTADVPIILLTIQRSEDILLKGLRRGADDVIFKPITQDELLVRTEMALKRKKRLDDLTGVIRRHLDPSVAYQIIKQPTGTMEFRRTHLAVLFSDLRGFTQVAESIEPEQTATLLNGLFEEMVRCVLRYGGTLDKFLGDGLMALFGAPIGYDGRCAPPWTCSARCKSSTATPSRSPTSPSTWASASLPARWWWAPWAHGCALTTPPSATR